MSQGVKILLTTGVLITAFTGLMWTSMKDAAAYYKHVDEVMVEPEVWAGKRLQVHGYASNISWKPSTMDYRFEIENNGYTVLAEYTGVVPDTFKEAPRSSSLDDSKVTNSSSSRTGSWRNVLQSMRPSRRLVPSSTGPPRRWSPSESVTRGSSTSTSAVVHTPPRTGKRRRRTRCASPGVQPLRQTSRTGDGMTVMTATT